MAGASNSPGERAGGMPLIDSGGHLRLFGGYAYDVNYDRADLNDLWKY